MDHLQTLQAVVILLTHIVLVVVACMARTYAGRRYLIAFTAFMLCQTIFNTLYRVFSMLAQSLQEHEALFSWLAVAKPFYYASLASLGIFLITVLFRDFSNSTLMQNVFSFSGRISRSQFWLLQLALWPATALPAFAVAGSGWPSDIPTTIHHLLAATLWLASIWITFASYSRRWHDIGKSGWMSLISIVPIAGPVAILILLGFRAGDASENVYGPVVASASHG